MARSPDRPGAYPPEDRSTPRPERRVRVGLPRLPPGLARADLVRLRHAGTRGPHRGSAQGAGANPHGSGGGPPPMPSSSSARAERALDVLNLVLADVRYGL